MSISKILILAIALSTSLSAKWQDIRVLKYNKNPENFNLKSGIEYIEIHSHNISEFYPDKKNKRRYYDAVWLKMGNKLLNSFGKGAVTSFAKYQKIAKRDNALVVYDNSTKRAYSFIYFNAYMIDSSGKQWFLENKQDLIDMIKPIDTPQEAALIMWLNGYSSLVYSNYRYRLKYKKLNSGYSILESYQKEDKEYGGCIDYKYISTIDRLGAIVKRSLVSKKSKLCGD